MMTESYYPVGVNPIHPVHRWSKVRSLVRAARRGDHIPAYAVVGDNLLSGTHRAAANDIMEMLGEPRRIPVIDVDDYPDGAEDLRALAEYGSIDYSGDELRAILAAVGAE